MVDKITTAPTDNTVVNKINEIIDNMGGTITVDQTYDGTSSNPQSGVAINGAKFIQNTATGTNSITIGGASTAGSNSLNIGKSSNANVNHGTAVGVGAKVRSESGIAVGYAIDIGTSIGGIGIGGSVSNSNYGIAIGGFVDGAVNSIQIGHGTNSTVNSLQIGFGVNNNYKLLDGTTGLIPDARISTNIARSSNIPTIDQTYDGTSANAQSGVAIAGELANYSNTNLSNITNTGKIAIAHNAMPTTSTVVVSSIANGGTYVAPHDGYLIATAKQVIASGGFVQLSGNAVSSSWVGSGMTGNTTYTTIPVKKGLTVTVVWYGFTGGVSLNFAPCIGSENEV